MFLCLYVSVFLKIDWFSFRLPTKTDIDRFCCRNKKIPRILEFFGIYGISPQIWHIWPFCPNRTLFPLKLKSQVRFWCQKGEICEIPAIWNLFWNHWNQDSKSVKFCKFHLFDIRIGSGALIWVGKVTNLGRSDKFGVFVARFHWFQKIPEFLEFFDSDCRIGFSDKNWVWKTPHIVILAKIGRIMCHIVNRPI